MNHTNYEQVGPALRAGLSAEVKSFRNPGRFGEPAHQESNFISYLAGLAAIGKCFRRRAGRL